MSVRNASIHGASVAGNVLVAASEHDEAAVGVRGARQLRREARLADARLAADQHDGRAVDLRLLPRVGEPATFVVAARERQLARLDAQRRGQRCRVVGARRCHGTSNAMTASGRPFSSSSPTTRERELGATAREAAHEVVAEDLTAVGRVAEPGSR